MAGLGDCGDYYDLVNYAPGLKTLDINADGTLVEVFCDDDGWTVIQSRGQFGNPIDLFYRNFQAYMRGFGIAGATYPVP